MRQIFLNKIVKFSKFKKVVHYLKKPNSSRYKKVNIYT